MVFKNIEGKLVDPTDFIGPDGKSLNGGRKKRQGETEFFLKQIDGRANEVVPPGVPPTSDFIPKTRERSIYGIGEDAADRAQEAIEELIAASKK